MESIEQSFKVYIDAAKSFIKETINTFMLQFNDTDATIIVMPNIGSLTYTSIYIRAITTDFIIWYIRHRFASDLNDSLRLKLTNTDNMYHAHNVCLVSYLTTHINEYIAIASVVNKAIYNIHFAKVRLAPEVNADPHGDKLMVQLQDEQTLDGKLRVMKDFALTLKNPQCVQLVETITKLAHK